VTQLRDADDIPALVLQLRRRRVPFDDIAKHLGITTAQANEFYSIAVAALPAVDRAEYLAEEMMLADDAIRDLLTIARDHAKSARTSVEAWNSIRGWAEHKARMAGLDRPEQQHTETRPGGLHAIRQARRA
jgi:hypothetical protein